jgi:hypothetical protein
MIIIKDTPTNMLGRSFPRRSLENVTIEIKETIDGSRTVRIIDNLNILPPRLVS